MHVATLVSSLHCTGLLLTESECVCVCVCAQCKNVRMHVATPVSSLHSLFHFSIQ